MELKIVEAGHPVNENGVGGNWGKFGIARFDVEWADKPEFPGTDGFPHIPLLAQLGWGPEHIWVLDLQTGEGALFLPGGLAKADLRKHRIWVCPMFEPFLEWLWEHTRTGRDWYARLPRRVELPDAQFAFSGYRRPGPNPCVRALVSYAEFEDKVEEWHKLPRDDHRSLHEYLGLTEEEYQAYVNGECPTRTCTSGGVPITEELVTTLAAEAEAGYDPSKLRPRSREA